MKNYAYWTAKFLTDWSLYLMVGILAIIFAAAFNTAFSGKGLGATSAVLLLSQV